MVKFENYSIKFNPKRFDQLFLMENNQPKFLVRYNFYGLYDPQQQTFIWGNSIPGVNKKFISKIKSIKSQSHQFENLENKKDEFIYQLLTQDLLYLQNPKKVELIKEIILSLSGDKDLILSLSSNGKLQFIGISHIDEKF